MRSVLYVLVGLGLTGGAVWADTVTLSSGATWESFSSVFNSSAVMTPNTTGQLTSPALFWDNWSWDTGVGGSHDMNIGYMLSGTGGFTSSPLPSDDGVTYTAVGGGTTMAPTDPSSFTFTPNPDSVEDVTLLGADSGNSTTNWNGTIYGLYYVVDGQTFYDPLYGPGTGNSYSDTVAIDIEPLILDASSYGFYATVCYASAAVGGACPSDYTETYYTDSNMNTGYVSQNESQFLDAGEYNHFALFGLAADGDDPNSGNWAIGFKDGPVSAEGLGDFNDVVIELTDPQLTTPEPATAGVVGLGLLALAIRRRYFAKV